MGNGTVWHLAWWLVSTGPIQLGLIALVWTVLVGWETVARRTVPGRTESMAAAVTVGWLVLYGLVVVVFAASFLVQM